MDLKSKKQTINRYQQYINIKSINNLKEYPKKKINDIEIYIDHSVKAFKYLLKF